MARAGGHLHRLWLPKGIEDRSAWPSVWHKDFVVPAIASLPDPKCAQLLCANTVPEVLDKGCERLHSVLTTSDALGAMVASGKVITAKDIEDDFDAQYRWYAEQGGLMNAGICLATSVVLLGLFLLAVPIGLWVFAGFREAP